MTQLRTTIHANRAGQTVALPSVCSAQPDVLAASLALAEHLNAPIVIEATSNQVNHLGGYTGMTPRDFATSLRRIAADVGCNMARVTLGGDHLGPQVWRKRNAVDAMAEAKLMMRAYVEAGFTKIHLDCSEPCADDPTPLTDDICAARAAELAAVCEAHAPDPMALNYIVGTEVPPPGGAREAEHAGVVPTTATAAKATLDAHRDAFARAGLADVWPRVCALVVQPGVEFSADTVDHLPKGDAGGLPHALDGSDGIAFEAHSTDYQRPDAFVRLADLGFAILKVGPALTFAYRRALYGLQTVLDDLDASPTPRLPDVMERLMLSDPSNWDGHYFGDDARLKLLRHDGLADRIRYYWAQPDARDAVAELMNAAEAKDLPITVLSRHFSFDVINASHGLLPVAGSLPRALIWAEIQAMLRPYFLSPKPEQFNDL